MPKHEVDEEEFKKFIEWKNTEKKKVLIAAIKAPERRHISWGRGRETTVNQLLTYLPVDLLEKIEKAFHPELDVPAGPPVGAPVTVTVARAPLVPPTAADVDQFMDLVNETAAVRFNPFNTTGAR